MFKSDNVLNVMIGKDLTRTSGLQITDPSTTATYIHNGELAILDETGNIMTSGSTISDTKSIKIVQGRGTQPLLFSSTIDGRSVLSFSGKTYSAYANQITNVGYNGTSGSFDATNSAAYTLRIAYKFDKEMWSEQMNVRNYYFEADATATQAEIASGICKSVNADTFNFVNAELLTDSSYSSYFGTTGTITFVNGSTVITCATTVGSFTSGDYIRPTGTSTTTLPVYKVVSASGTTITIDTPYQGVSGTSGALDRISATNAATGNFGIKLTGKDLDFRTGYYKWNVVSFEVQLGGMGTTTISESTRPTKGTGSGKAVAELEWYAMGNEGITNRAYFPTYTRMENMDAVTGSNYDIVSIAYFDASENHIITGQRPMRKELIIAAIDGSSQMTQFMSDLNTWMASLPNSFGNVTI